MNSQHYAENISELMHYQKRTRFPIRGADKLLTMNKGLLYPIYTFETLPGDTWQMYIRNLVRATTMIKPIFNNLWIQIQCFHVPNRLNDPHWEEIMGANKQGPWITNKTTYTVPKLTAPEGGWAKGTIADNLDFPTYVPNLEVNSYYTKGYCLIWNDWYRDENRMNFTHITQEGDLQGSNGNNYVTDAELGGALLPVCKRHDLFTSSSIEAQKGPDVLLPLGTSAPVKGNDIALGFIGLNDESRGVPYGAIAIQSGTNDRTTISASTSAYGKDIKDEGTYTENIFADGRAMAITPDGAKSGMVADLSKASAASVNQLRTAIALQQLYELDAISGTRYIEIIYSHFNVRSSDARLQRSEYLGGKSIPLNITQVIQNSSSSGDSFQGNMAGISQTWDGDEYFTKSFEEHGIMYIMACIKGENVYQQGLDAKFSKFKRTDYYDPIFANLGMQPLFNRELMAQGNSKDSEVFGYKEAWDEYRVFPNHVSGEFRSNAPNSIDYWHIARDFSELPTNGEEFIKEGQINLDRALTVASDVADQFQVQFSLDGSSVTRIMPAHSVPGLKRF